MTEIATTGNKGKGIRSDCFVTLELTKGGGINLQLESRVGVMYGNSIRKLAFEIMEFFGVKNANLTIEDAGALPLVIAARIEAALKQLYKTDKEFLLPVPEEHIYTTARDRNRFSRLYLPGNSPALMINAGIHHPDGIILDLEDAVAPDKKFEARFLVRNALRSIDFYGAEHMVRINQGERGLEDLEYVTAHNVNLILLPKCEHPDQIHAVNKKIQELITHHSSLITHHSSLITHHSSHITHHSSLITQIWLMPIIESALGVINAYSIASSADNVVALAIGLEDYTADLGTRRTLEGKESFFARSMVVNAARAAGIQPIDSVFSDIGDMEALRQNVMNSKALGFDGMGCIHPRQIKVIHETFAPTSEEIEKAKKIVFAFHEAEKKGLGVVALGNKMIDPPVVKRALNTINLAVKMNKLGENWRESYEI